MANRKINDTESISAYLDGKLGPRERERLETRLRREPALQAELEALDRTRSLLRAAPRYRAPRNFTLTPEMAGIREDQPGFLFGLTRLAFTMTTILFVVALVGNFSFKRFTGAQPEAATAMSADTGPGMAPLAPAPGEVQEGASDAAADSGPADSGDAGRTQPVESMEAEESVDSGGNPDEPEGLAPPTEISLAVAAEEETVEDPIVEGTLTAPSLEAPAVEKSPEIDTFAQPETAAGPGGADQSLSGDEAGRINPWSIFTVLTGAAALLSGALMVALRRR